MFNRLFCRVLTEEEQSAKDIKDIQAWIVELERKSSPEAGWKRVLKGATMVAGGGMMIADSIINGDKYPLRESDYSSTVIGPGFNVTCGDAFPATWCASENGFKILPTGFEACFCYNGFKRGSTITKNCLNILMSNCDAGWAFEAVGGGLLALGGAALMFGGISRSCSKSTPDPELLQNDPKLSEKFLNNPSFKRIMEKNGYSLEMVENIKTYQQAIQLLKDFLKKGVELVQIEVGESKEERKKDGKEYRRLPS